MFPQNLSEDITALSTNEDFFSGLHSDRLLKWFFVTLAMFLLPINSLLLYSITWYEHFGSDLKRTIINKFVSSVCWTGIELSFFIQGITISCYIFGPFPAWLCYFRSLAMYTVLMQLFLFADAILVCRFTFVFILKNPAAFNDDFWSKFVNIWVILFGIISQSIYQILPGRRALEFHFCSGTNPNLDQDIIKVNYTLFAVFSLSLFINIVIPIKIKLYRMKNQKNDENEHISLTDLTTNIFIFLITGLNVTSLAGLNTIKNPAVINQYPNYIYVYLFQLFFPSSNICFLTLIYYCRHKPLRNCIIRNIKEKIEPYCYHLPSCITQYAL